MRTHKYGISAKLVAARATELLGLNCDERSARAALAQYYYGGMVFKTVDAAAQAIAAYHRAHGKFPRSGARMVNPADVNKPTGLTIPSLRPAASRAVAADASLEREVGHAVLLLRRLGFKVEAA